MFLLLLLVTFSDDVMLFRSSPCSLVFLFVKKMTTTTTTKVHARFMSVSLRARGNCLIRRGINEDVHFDGQEERFEPEMKEN